MNKPLKINHLSLSFIYKTCFENFSTSVAFGSKIALLGDNGSGKSTLLKTLAGETTLVEGELDIPAGTVVGYVPQIIYKYSELSGGQRFNKILSEELALNPDILLLDEPTNHLDIYNRKSLMNMLKRFTGTLVVVSHDTELLRKHVDQLWHIDKGQIHVFSGRYDDYMAKHAAARAGLEEEKEALEKEKRCMHKKLMQEQERASKSRQQGENSRKKGKWAPIVAGGKERLAQTTAGKKNSGISSRKEAINEQLRGIYVPEILTPTFTLDASASSYVPLFISEGSVGYPGKTILSDINVSIVPNRRVAVIGGNGSGKTTLLRAIMADPAVEVSGTWERPALKDLGYLDQHYHGPAPKDTVIGYIQSILPGWTGAQVRKHLNDFLFRKNEEVNASVSILSGGERARLALAAIACKVPRLLILDEITNNLDLRTKEHVAQVLSAYPGALLVVSHEPDFLRQIGVSDIYLVQDGRLIKTELDD